jgi:uncharacterized protein YndB with AHSA1/START domain
MMPPLPRHASRATLLATAELQHFSGTRMTIIKWLLGIMVLLVAVVTLGGMLLSPKFTVTRSVSVNAPPEKVYELVADPQRWKEWSVWNQRDPAMQITYSGPPSGSGAAWSWKSASEGSGKMTFTTAESGKQLSYDLFFADFATMSKGDLTFKPTGAATEVTWTLLGDMGKNPVFRWLALFADRMVGKDFEAGLSNLKALAEKP